MKKIIITVLSFVLAVSTSLTAVASFDDVSDDNGNVDAIDFLSDAGVVKGYDDGTFKPKFEINRAELMKILVEAQGVTPDADEYSDCFTDVTDQWFAPYVCYAKDVEWVEGYKDGSFAPDKFVNKVEAVKMIINSQGFGEETGACKEELHEDVDEDDWYGPYLCVAYKKGLLEEGLDGNYLPGAEIDRSQVAENIFRAIMVKKLKKEEFKAEYKEMKGEALDAFKAEKEAIKAEIEAFKKEIEQMKEDGEDADYIKAQRDEFWGNLKELHKDHVEGLAGKLKEAHDHLKGQKDAVKEEFKACKEKLKNGPNGQGDLMAKCGYDFDDFEYEKEDDEDDSDDLTDVDDDDSDDDDDDEDDDDDD
ncbi:hypothetical protein HN709_00120, partial [Candidatus Peregrinibacteria bacterium]|nr:hypothetical protein [Candidatus Peregrinibacteria bacterium]